MASGRKAAAPAVAPEAVREVRGTAHAAIYAELKAALMNGDLKPGDRFELDREVPHAERYGPEGTTFWVARSASLHGG